MKLRIDYTHLAALLAVQRSGSFEGAGRLIGMSAIGVSRRVAKFERRLGTALLDRRPTRPTKAGAALCRYAEKIEELENRLLTESIQYGLQDARSNGQLTIAVSEIASSTWFGGVLDEYSMQSSSSGRSERKIEVTIADPDDTFDLMATGTVSAAITTSKAANHGFKSYSVGKIGYLAVASPVFAEHHFYDVPVDTALKTAPTVRTSNRDKRALDWIEALTGKSASILPRCIPCSSTTLKICMRGTVWALLPAAQARVHIAEGSLVEIAPGKPFEQAHYWHIARALDAEFVDLTSALRKTAKTFNA